MSGVYNKWPAVVRTAKGGEGGGCVHEGKTIGSLTASVL